MTINYEETANIKQNIAITRISYGIFMDDNELIISKLSSCLAIYLKIKFGTSKFEFLKLYLDMQFTWKRYKFC